ncbi:MAG: PorV/PorQ family protein [Gemmatimonadota bacterium]|nr:PorV/PorQ family protein [Gemmatimonadota bacterium]
MQATARVLGVVLAVVFAATPGGSAAAQIQVCNGGGPFAGGDCDGGVHSMTILGIPISPRAIALGEAMGSIDRDPAAIWYNAAGLAGLTTNAFTVNAAQRFAQTQLIGAAVAFPTELATFGVAARVFNAGTVENYLSGERIGGNTRAYQWALEGGGALQLARWWRWGGTLVFSQESLGDETTGSVGINSGMQFPEIAFDRRLSLSGGIRNFGTSANFDEDFEGFSPPLAGFAGASFDLLRQRNLLRTPMLFRGQPIIFDAKALAQINLPDRHEPYVGFGVEATLNGVAIARAGYQTGDDNRAGLSLGAGVNVGQFRLEYAFRNYENGGANLFENDPVGDAHNVGFTYFWGGPRENIPVVPVVVTQPVDTAAINASVRQAIQEELGKLRSLLDSLRESRVEIIREGDISRYIVPVYFGFDSADIRPQDTTVLRQVAEVIRRVYPAALVAIEGFADPAGSVEYNLRLSERRAEAVKAYMMQLGLPERQFRTLGRGKEPERQVTPGAERDQPGAELNRRVTFTIDVTQRF